MAKEEEPDRDKKARKIRVDFRPNRARPARDRSWTRQYQEHGFEESETQAGESVVAKGHLSRKRTVRTSQDASDLPLGRVVAMHGLIAQVEIDGQVHGCTVRRVLRTRRIKERHPVAVGDRVRVDFGRGSGDADPPARRPGVEVEGVIEWVEPREGCLTRRYANRTHTIAANVDQAIIVTSAAQPYCKPHLIDRYLVSAHAGGIRPVICFNKADLDAEQIIPAVRKRYDDLDYITLCTSATTREGLEEFETALRGRTSVLAGQSGVGKSSLLNAIQPGLNLRVARVSRDTEKGTHTTSTAELLRLKIGGYVVDTPGIKTLELADVDRTELEMYFVDLERFVADCKFPDCTHTHETGCAVKQAVDRGAIHPDRYESYVRLFTDE